jgi:predicted HAD superfamily Cof-like phosphohydrolase
MKKSTIEMVEEFHAANGIKTPASPRIPDCSRCELRLSLLEEELRELRVALFQGERTSALDALCDLQYVLDGTFLELGMGEIKDVAFAEVHRSNMSKLGPDGKPVLRADGKIGKGPNYEPPHLNQFLPAT